MNRRAWLWVVIAVLGIAALVQFVVLPMAAVYMVGQIESGLDDPPSLPGAKITHPRAGQVVTFRSGFSVTIPPHLKRSTWVVEPEVDWNAIAPGDRLSKETLDVQLDSSSTVVFSTLSSPPNSLAASSFPIVASSPDAAVQVFEPVRVGPSMVQARMPNGETVRVMILQARGTRTWPPGLEGAKRAWTLFQVKGITLPESNGALSNKRVDPTP